MSLLALIRVSKWEWETFFQARSVRAMTGASCSSPARVVPPVGSPAIVWDVRMLVCSRPLVRVPRLLVRPARPAGQIKVTVSALRVVGRFQIVLRKAATMSLLLSIPRTVAVKRLPPQTIKPPLKERPIQKNSAAPIVQTACRGTGFKWGVPFTASAIRMKRATEGWIATRSRASPTIQAATAARKIRGRLDALMQLGLMRMVSKNAKKQPILSVRPWVRAGVSMASIKNA